MPLKHLFIAAVTLTLLGVLPRDASAQDVQRVAVLELRSASVSSEVRLQLSDELRVGVISAVRGRGLGVMTRENMAVLLQDMGLDPTCVEAECEVETGRNIGARYVVSGTLLKVEGTYVITVKVHDTLSALVIDSRTERATTLLALLTKGQEMGASLSEVILRHLGSQVEEGSIGQGGEWGVKKGDQGVVRFESTPQGATVFVDGDLQCKATPCDAELSEGEHSVEFQLSRHYPARASFSAATGKMKTVSERLKPKFGVIRFTSTPSAAVGLDGREVCRQTPCEVRVDPGQHEVQMQASDFHAVAQVFLVTEGGDQAISLELKPAFATLDVRTRLKEALVQINGVQMQAPTGVMRRSPGPVEVSLAERCYKADPLILELKEGDARQVTLRVAPRMVVLDVEVAERSGGLAPGHFLLDGKNWGSNPHRGSVSACSKTLTLVQYGETVWSKRLSGELSESRPTKLRPEVAQNTRWKKWKRKNAQASDGWYRALGMPMLPTPLIGPGWGFEVGQSLDNGEVHQGVRFSLTAGVLLLGSGNDALILGGLGELFLQHTRGGDHDSGWYTELNGGLTGAGIFEGGSAFGPTFGVGLGYGEKALSAAHAYMMLRLRYAPMSGSCSSYGCRATFTGAPAILAEATFTIRSGAS